MNNFFILNVFEVEDSILRCFSKLPRTGDLENPGQLPVSEVLSGTVDWVLWISIIFSFLTMSMSGNLFIKVSAVILRWFQNSRSISGFAGTRRYWRFGLMDFS